MEAIKRIEKISENLTRVEQSAEYAHIMQAAIQIQKDNFEMLDRSLLMMQSVHGTELKNADFYIDVIKFLLPIFATSAITGAVVSLPNVNSTALTTIGVMGVALLFIALAPLLIQRHKMARRQNIEYQKLFEAFQKWQKMAEIQKMIVAGSDNLKDWESIVKDMQVITKMEMTK